MIKLTDRDMEWLRLGGEQAVIRNAKRRLQRKADAKIAAAVKRGRHAPRRKLAPRMPNPLDVPDES